MPYGQPGQYDLNRFRGRFSRQLRRDQPRGQETEDEALGRIREFDPMSAARDASAAQSKDFFEELSRNLDTLRGSQVSRGRLDTGFAFADEDELVSEGVEDFGDSVAARSMQAAGLEAQNNRDLLGAGERFTGRYLDILSGERDTQLMLDNLERERKARKRGGIGALLGGGLGALLGGPAGATAGAGIGSAVSELF